MQPFSIPKFIMDGIVPIARFNNGEASQIFSEVKVVGAKVVVENDAPVCVLLSPEEYLRLMDVLGDEKVLDKEKAVSRLIYELDKGRRSGEEEGWVSEEDVSAHFQSLRGKEEHKV